MEEEKEQTPYEELVEDEEYGEKTEWDVYVERRSKTMDEYLTNGETTTEYLGSIEAVSEDYALIKAREQYGAEKKLTVRKAEDIKE